MTEEQPDVKVCETCGNEACTCETPKEENSEATE